MPSGRGNVGLLKELPMKKKPRPLARAPRLRQALRRHHSLRPYDLQLSALSATMPVLCEHVQLATPAESRPQGPETRVLAV